jgi:hypothetical protein
MLNSASKRSQAARDVPADASVQPERVSRGQTGRRFGPREQQSLLEAAYVSPEPEVGEYSGIVKVAILATGCVASWGAIIGVVMFARFLGGF